MYCQQLVPTSIDLIPLPPNRPDPSIHFPSPGGKPSSEQPHVAGSNKWKVASVSQSGETSTNLWHCRFIIAFIYSQDNVHFGKVMVPGREGAVQLSDVTSRNSHTISKDKWKTTLIRGINKEDLGSSRYFAVTEKVTIMKKKMFGKASSTCYSK